MSEEIIINIVPSTSDNIQVNTSTSPTDVNVSASGSGVMSVNGRYGDIILTKNDVGLSDVDNTSDLNKPVSYETLSALLLKTDLGLFLTLNDYVTSDSINWNSSYSTLCGLSSNWSDAYTNLIANSSFYLSGVDLSFLSVSANWNSVYNNVNEMSSKYILNGGNDLLQNISVGTKDMFELNLLTNNLTRVNITSSGMVGINTSTPKQHLHVQGNITVPWNAGGSAQGKIGIGSSDGSTFLNYINQSSRAMNFTNSESLGGGFVFNTATGTQRVIFSDTGTISTTNHGSSNEWSSVYSNVNSLSSNWEKSYAVAAVSSTFVKKNEFFPWIFLKDMSQYQIATERTGTANVIGYLRDGINATLPTNVPYPIYRLTSPSVASRTATDFAVVRGNISNTVTYFIANERGKIDFNRPIEVYIRIAAPTIGFSPGLLQFGLGYSSSLGLASIPVGNDFPNFPDTGIGFRLERSGSSLLPRIITKPTGTSGSLIVTSTGTAISPISTVNYFLLRYLPTGVLSLYLINNGTENLLISHNNSSVYVAQTTSHNVNWFVGINPKTYIGEMTYDVEPPNIMF